MKELESEDKIKYMTIATNISGFGFNTEQIQLLISLYEGVITKGGELNVRDIAEIQAAIIRARKI